MLNFARLAGCVVLVFLEVHLVHGKQWRGITPLYSTREDVIRVLGHPQRPGDLHNLPNEFVRIDYSSGTCNEGGVWNVPRDTVQRITVSPKKSLSINDIQFNLNEYEKVLDNHLPGIIYYNNPKDGVRITTDRNNVRSVDYLPTSHDDHLRCPIDTVGPPLTKEGETLDSHTLFDSYGKMAFTAERQRLDLLGRKLRELTKVRVYIVAHPGQRMSLTEAMSRATHAKRYLVRNYKLPDSSIEIIKGHSLEEFTIRLYVVSKQ